jgi:hypothetical protein
MTKPEGVSDGAARTAVPRDRIGWLGQVSRVDSFTVDDGPARGTRLIRLVNGGGLEIEVLPDRALDIGRVTVGGIPVAWMSPVDVVSPAFYEPQGNGWLRTFGGGLLATCGLDAFGPASYDGGDLLGMHGRIGAVPARMTHGEADESGVRVEGVVRQTGVFAENLVMKRRIVSAFGSDKFAVEDTVTNDGSEAVPHMILYHVNLGWPLLSPETVLTFPDGSVTPRDEDALGGILDHSQLGPPQRGFREQVFIHQPKPDLATVIVANPTLPLELQLTFDARRLPALYQWKMLGVGHYVLGIEPANTPNVFGRAAARVAAELPFLEPGESVGYRLEFQLKAQ